MKFTFCPHCGTQLVQKSIGDEGLMPYCEHCQEPMFDIFPCATISLVADGRGNVLLLRQGYISTQYANLVSGYLKAGETAETCASREIKEETGLVVTSLQLKQTYWFAKKQMLMIAFWAQVDGTALHLSSEVDSAEWVAAADAVGQVHPAGSVSRTLIENYIKEHAAL